MTVSKSCGSSPAAESVTICRSRALRACCRFVSGKILFVTGTDTGVGKTVIAVALTRAFRKRGLNAAGMKPVCSGGRSDARCLWEASDRAVALDEVNPWHFRAPLAPVLAARIARRKLFLRSVAPQIADLARRFACLIVEGAGGLLSPLGEDFDSRDLLHAVGAMPVLVASNRLGAVNQVRLSLEALPEMTRSRTTVLLVNPASPGVAARTNVDLMSRFHPKSRLFTVPWDHDPVGKPGAAFRQAMSKVVAALLR